MTIFFVPTMAVDKPTKQARFMVWGGVGAGKSTLIQALTRPEISRVRKTQTIAYQEVAIDTPGEYAERGYLRQSLQATAFDARVLVVVQDATRSTSFFPPNYFLMFPQPVIGVVSKTDLATGAQVERATRLLRQIGVVGEIFNVSAINGSGLDQLRQSLSTYLE